MGVVEMEEQHEEKGDWRLRIVIFLVIWAAVCGVQWWITDPYDGITSIGAVPETPEQAIANWWIENFTINLFCYYFFNTICI